MELKLPKTLIEKNEPLSTPWAIIGAGPVGSMQAVIFATLFPGQKIYVLDKRHKHIRGHGLQLWNSSIDAIIELLTDSQQQAKTLLKTTSIEDIVTRKCYQKVIANIDQTIAFLKKNFKDGLSSTFIRTYKICEILQEYAKKLSLENDENKPIEFLLDNGVTTQHLQGLMKVSPDENTHEIILEIPAYNEEPLLGANNDEKTIAILQNSSVIFGADGSHSQTRNIIFNESDDDLQRETFRYLLEIKLDMDTNPNFILDQITKSLVPSLTKGGFHFWRQSKDGNATLNIIISKEIYDALRKKKDERNEPLGTHANPYRRLVDLPLVHQKAVSAIIIDIIGIDNFNANALKITAIPLQTYQANNLITQIGNKLFALVGDSAAGLVLAKGVNNGLIMAAEYGKALFNFFYLNKESSLQECEIQIKKRTNEQIQKIGSEFRLMNYVGESFGSIASPYNFDQHFFSTVKHFSNITITDEKLFNKYANWLLRLDIFHIQLKRLFEEDYLNLTYFISATNTYVRAIESNKSVKHKEKATESYKNQLWSTDHHPYFASLAQQLLMAGNQLIAYEAAQIDAKIVSFNDAIMRCSSDELKTPLVFLSEAIEKELSSPSETNAIYLNVLACFTNILGQLTKKTLTLQVLETELKQLDEAVYGKPPLATPIKILIGSVIGAIVGVITGLIVGAVLTGWAGGFGALPAAIIGGINGASIGAAVAVGGISITGVLAGSTIGFFSGKRDESKYNDQKMELNIYDAVEEVKTAIRSLPLTIA